LELFFPASLIVWYRRNYT